MYVVSKFEDRQMMAVSVPPDANETLDEDFQELSRIHFYLGRAPIDHMIKAVEKASLKDIEKGKIQIYFAIKEIQEFFRSSWSNLSTFGDDKLDPAIYFNKTFKDILSHTVEVLEKAYKSPTKKKNIETIETMMSLAHEVFFLNKELNNAGIKTEGIKDLADQTKEGYEKLLDIKNFYENLSGLKEFDSYKEEADKSVVEQLKQPYGFNYSELTRIYEPHDGDWVYTLQRIRQTQKDINTDPEYPFNEKDSEELKKSFLKQISGFNRLLKNGVVNYVYSFAASISREASTEIRKSQITPEEYFNRAVGYHENQLAKAKNSYYIDKNYHQEEIKKLKKIKEEFISKKMDDQTFREQYLTILHRQETNIFQTLDKVKANNLGVKLKDTLTFEGDITTGFVIGTFSNSDKVLLVHKDPFVGRHEAIYAMIMTKERYDDLTKNNKLVFTEELRESEFSNASNFWNYGQFLQEINESRVQEFFLGQEFDLVDKTVLKEDSEQKKKIKF